MLPSIVTRTNQMRENILQLYKSLWRVENIEAVFAKLIFFQANLWKECARNKGGSSWLAGHGFWSRGSILDDPGWLKMQLTMKGIERGEERGGDDRGQARPEPPGWEDKRQRWRHFMVTISTCPSVAATGTTQPRRGWQGTANLSGDKTERHR